MQLLNANVLLETAKIWLVRHPSLGAVLRGYHLCCMLQRCSKWDLKHAGYGASTAGRGLIMAQECSSLVGEGCGGLMWDGAGVEGCKASWMHCISGWRMTSTRQSKRD
jgi:hypothetical protein